MYRLSFHVQHRSKIGIENEWNRDEFLAMVSHELRTPTTAILGWADLLSRKRTDEEMVARGTEVIRRNARLQAQLIEQLLDYSRLSSGCLSLDSQRVELGPILESVIETMVPLAGTKGIEIEARLDSSVLTVYGDPARLQQVFTNLLSNAIKFTPTGGRIEVKLEGKGRYAEIIVSDNGRGISAEFLPHVFERFRQEHSAEASRGGGLGLGLAIVKHLVERQGGKIMAQSRGEGKGTTFTVWLPLEEDF